MTEVKKLNVFVISSWYPTDSDAFFGYFVKQTSFYLSEKANICVLNINNRTKFSKPTEIVNIQSNSFKEINYYIPASRFRIINSIKYLYFVNKAYKKAVKLNGKPDVIHLQIISVLLWYVYFLKIFNNIPFVVSEHWSKYFNLKSTLIEKIKYKFQNHFLKKASDVIVVSEMLAESMIKKGFICNFKIISNPVDQNLFQITNRENSKTFVHISCFDETIKNISGIVEAVEILNQKHIDFEIVLIGDGPDFNRIFNLVKSKKISNIRFTGTLDSEEVNVVLNQSLALIMNSYKETFGIPIVESWMCGRPVISTPVGIANKNHPEGFIFHTKFDTPNTIAEAMLFLMNHPLMVKSDEIREYAVKNFGKSKIIDEYIEVYENACKSNT